MKLADFRNSVVASAGPPVPGVSFLLRGATTADYCAPELFSDHHTFKGDVWSIGVICSELMHIDPDTRCVWSEADPLTEAGRQSWVDAATKHSETLQKIRGTGPLSLRLMGMDLCAACCRMDIHDRLSAEEAANHPFIISCRRWSAEMDMISDLAPLLRHMPPGDVRGPGSHEWMMTSLPKTH